MNVENFFPYNQMTIESDTTIGACVRIPKIYVKNSVDEDGLITREISQKLQEGYHCHPAFLQYDPEQEVTLERDSILIASNVVDGDPVTFDQAQAAINGIGGTQQTLSGSTYGEWKTILANTKHETHMYNIYEHHLIALLMLIEFETTDFRTAMELDPTAATANWRGITQHWGDIDEWIDGLRNVENNGYISIFDNQGKFNLIQTTQNIQNGYPITVSNASGENWNLGDIFIANQTTQTKTEGSFGSQQIIGTLGQNDLIATISKTTSPTENQNSFSITGLGTSNKAHYRLAKFADIEE